MKLKKLLLWLLLIIGFGFGLGSILICGGIVISIFFHDKITFIEPNLSILSIEFIGLLISLISLLILMKKYIDVKL